MGQINATILEQPIAMLDGKIPGINGYLTGITDVPGVVAANNFMTLFNPVASGKKIIILGVYVSTYIVTGSSNARNSLQGQLATGISGGTLVGASSIVELDSTGPSALAEVRIGNPTATAGANIFNSPPSVGTSVTQYVHAVGLGFGTVSGGLILNSGEGLVMRTAAGTTGQTWNISLGWGEY